jgi:hypothetical protein
MQRVMDKAERIAALNDRFRQTFWGGKVMMTQGVQELPDATREKLFRAVSEFDDFTEDNDPHSEHDFGRIQLDGHTFFWKVDYFDHTMCFGADDPSDNHNTTRVLTIMLASEY